MKGLIKFKSKQTVQILSKNYTRKLSGTSSNPNKISSNITNAHA